MFVNVNLDRVKAEVFRVPADRGRDQDARIETWIEVRWRLIHRSEPGGQDVLHVSFGINEFDRDGVLFLEFIFGA
jgi:hypothetical protein